MYKLEKTSVNDTSDADIIFTIKLAQDGDQKAINQLLAQYQQKIKMFIKYRVDNSADVDDLVQETFVQLCQSLNNYQRRSSFSSWVLGIALNLVRNYYNRSPQFKYSFVDELLDFCESDGRSLEASLDVKERLSVLINAVSKLPEHLRQPTYMICVENRSYESVAAEMEISVSNLKSRLFRARKKLAKVLD